MFVVKVDFDQTRRPLRARAGHYVDLWLLRIAISGRARATKPPTSIAMILVAHL